MILMVMMMMINVFTYLLTYLLSYLLNLLSSIAVYCLASLLLLLRSRFTNRIDLGSFNGIFTTARWGHFVGLRFFLRNRLPQLKEHFAVSEFF